MIDLSLAQKIVEAALARGRELALKPLTVAVLDKGGHLVALAREDGSSNMRPQIAIGKASGALSLGVSSRVIGDMAAERPVFVGTVASLATNGIIPAAGGLLVKDANGQTIGAVGVTGDTSDNDELCAFAGIETAGLAH